MLKILKWAYDLGIRHERVRIASHLQVQSTMARNSIGVMDDMIRHEMTDKKRPNKRMVERLEFDKAVNHRVEEIIQDIFHDDGEWVYGNSIMFPDDGLSKSNKKGKK